MQFRLMFASSLRGPKQRIVVQSSVKDLKQTQLQIKPPCRRQKKAKCWIKVGVQSEDKRDGPVCRSIADSSVSDVHNDSFQVKYLLFYSRSSAVNVARKSGAPLPVSSVLLHVVSLFIPAVSPKLYGDLNKYLIN